MSTTTAKKDEKELSKDVATVETVISSLTFTQLEDLLKTKREEEIEKVTHRLKEARGMVESLEAQLENLGVTPAPLVSAAPAKRRGRKPGSKNKAKLNGAAPRATTPKARKGKRGAVGEAISAFVASKGKAGAKVNEIAQATGNKPANVTAFFYAKGNKGKFKKVAPATFAVAK